MRPTSLFEDIYARQHKSLALAAGASESEWADAMNNMRLDRWATVEHQLNWLSEAGFVDADCLYKNYRFAVMVVLRAG